MFPQARIKIKSSSVYVLKKQNKLKIASESMKLVAFGLVLLECLQSLADPGLQGKAHVFKYLCHTRYYSACSALSKDMPYLIGMLHSELLTVSI